MNEQQEHAEAIFAVSREQIAKLISEVVVIFIVEKRTPRIFIGDLADGVTAALASALSSDGGVGRGQCPEVTFMVEIIRSTPRQIKIGADIGGVLRAVARLTT